MLKIQRFAVAAIVALALSQLTARADEAAKKMLQGTWTVTALKANGEAAPADDVKGMTLIFKDDKVIGTKDGKEEDPEPYVLIMEGEQLRIVITEKEGKKYHGILKFEDEGKKMMLCVTNGAEFPKNFDAGKPEKENVLVMCFALTKN